jgi:SHS2 domain-containing protein
MESSAGFRERAHTADWELQVWAPTLGGLLEQAALGMFSLSGMRLEDGPHQERTLSLQAIDAEGLLVRFLGELLWLAEQDRLGFQTYELVLSGQDSPQPLHLEARMHGARIAGLDKEIKAVTYHNLAVRQTRNGFEAYIVFDV